MDYFYHNSIKNYTIALLDLFNDIRIPRYNSKGDRISDSKVPVKFGNRDKAYQLSEHDIENLVNGNVNILPRMVIQFNGMDKALNRNTNKNQKINRSSLNTLETEYHYNSVSYDFNFTLFIATRTFTDAAIIVEQIAPMFRPDISIKVQEMDIMEEETTVPISIGDFDFELPELDPDEIRVIEVSLPVVLKGNLYLPIKNSKIIKEIDLNMIITDSDLNKKGKEYEFLQQPSKIEINADDYSKEEIDLIKSNKTDYDIVQKDIPQPHIDELIMEKINE